MKYKIENDSGENITVKSSADAVSMVRLMLENDSTPHVVTVTVTDEHGNTPRK